MKNKLLNYICIFIILIFSFILFLTLSSSFSSKRIFENVKESSEVLFEEGNRKIIYIPYRNVKMQFDNYTDALMINTAYSIDNSKPLYSSFVARKNYIPEVTNEVYQDVAGELRSSSKYEYHNEVGELKDLVNGEKTESFEYGRYWHGYLMVLRPLLLVFNLKQIRILLTIILALLAIILTVNVSKKIDPITAIIIFTGLLGGEYFYLGFSLQGVFVFIIAMISSIIMIRRYDRIKDFSILFFVTGILTNFFDFLTVPIVTLLMPLILYFLLKKKEDLTTEEIIKTIFKYTFIWGIGYGLTWFTKWLLMDLLFNRSMIKVALAQVLYRSVSKGGQYNMLKVIKENTNYIIVPMFISIFSTCICECIRILKTKGNNEIQSVDLNELAFITLPFIIISIFPLVLYIALQNHSFYHAFFTYRNLIIFNICINIIIDKTFKNIIKGKEYEK